MGTQSLMQYQSVIPICANSNRYRKSVELGHVHQQILNAVETENWQLTQLTAVEIKVALFLYLLAVDSLVCRPEVLKAIYDQLVKREFQNHYCKQGYFIEINQDIDGLALNSNDCSKRTTLFRCFLSPLALASMHKLYLIADEEWESIKGRDKKDLIDLINFLVSAFGIAEFSSLSVFCSVAAEFSMRNIHTKAPLFLKEFACGAMASHTMPLQSLHLFHQRKTLTEFVIEPLVRVTPKAKQQFKTNRSTENEGSKPSTSYIHLIQFITTLLTIDRDYDRKKELGYLVDRLKKALYENDFDFSTRLLLEWMLFNLGQNQWKHPETPKKYFRKVGEDWLKWTVDEDLLNMDGAEMDFLCQQITQYDNAQGEKRWRLRSLIIFSVTHFGLTAPDDPFYSVSESSKYVRSLVIPPRIANQIGQELRQLYLKKDDFSRRVIQALYIVISRLFLRPTEAVRLLIKDVELSKEGCLFIRPHKNHRLKTINSRRAVPFGLLLLPEERDIFEIFVKLRLQHTSGNTDAYLFSKSALSNVPFTTSEIENILSPVISKYFGYPVPIYQFRHSGISSLAAVIFGSDDFITQFTVYTIEQANSIKEGLVGRRNRDKLWAVAMAAGHQTPHTTMFSYIHNCELLLADIFEQSEKYHSAKFWLNLSGLPVRQLKLLSASEQSQTGNKAGDITISSKRILPNLIKKLEKYVFRDAVVDRRSFADEPAAIDSVRPDIHQCYDVLRKVDAGLPLADILLASPVDECIAKAWIDSASSIVSQYQSRNGQPRLVSKMGKVCPYYQKLDDGDLETILKCMRNAYSNSPTDLDWCIEYTLSHVTNVKSYIRFNNVNDYLRFMKIAKTLASIDRWYLKLELGHQNLSLAVKWHSVEGVNVIQQAPRTDSAEIGKLFFSKPFEAEQTTANQASSRAIRFLFHMAKIMRDAKRIISSK